LLEQKRLFVPWKSFNFCVSHVKYCVYILNSKLLQLDCFLYNLLERIIARNFETLELRFQNYKPTLHLAYKTDDAIGSSAE